MEVVVIYKILILTFIRAIWTRKLRMLELSSLKDLETLRLEERVSWRLHDLKAAIPRFLRVRNSRGSSD